MKGFQSIVLALFFTIIIACSPSMPVEDENSQNYQRFYPAKDLGELFETVQLSGLYNDSKYFVDFSPKKSPDAILNLYREQKDQEDFDLKAFVDENFDYPIKIESKPLDQKSSLEDHIPNHWDYLTRSSDDIKGYSSLLPLPEPYVVPGGRFREIYYWDSYFTMIGLGATGRIDLMESMLDNFAHLIEDIGYIPNGNRTYFLGRSQPPFFSSMVNLYTQYEGDSSALKYLKAIQTEYDFWMDGAPSLEKAGEAYRRVVRLENGMILNRYFDDNAEPRPESYAEDIELAEALPEEKQMDVYRNIRAACESGWDFSARWFAEGTDFTSIITTSLLPVDLNSLLYQMEVNLAKFYRIQGDLERSEKFGELAEQRKEAIQKLFWNENAGIFTDFNFVTNSLSPHKTLAGCYPLYFHINDADQAKKVAETIRKEFLLPGGVTTTLVASGQQWDYPNGWAPLQWVTIKGLSHYDETDLAERITDNWLQTNRKVFDNTQKLMEKYNVADTSLTAGGGEYPTQDGFGWTNGVAIGLIKGTDKY